LKNYYELLELAQTANAEEVKKTFRVQIARYHPDKVHHLGKEFQEMAANRAAELTEAYRVLSHEGRRAEYDAALKTAAAAGAAAPGTTAGPAPSAAPAAGHAAPTPPQVSAEPDEPSPARPVEAPKLFVQERASRDTFVRKAIVDRVRQAMAQAVGGNYDESQERGWDVAVVPKSKLFARGKGPRLLVKFVSKVDAAAIADAWSLVAKMGLRSGDEACIVLMATDLAPARELAGAIAEQRRKPARGVKITLIPVNASVWDAHMPTDAPEIAKTLLSRLKAGG
jgi:curved DNA-binding protein CbpA